jgi:hypothetical protein
MKPFKQHIFEKLKVSSNLPDITDLDEIYKLLKQSHYWKSTPRIVLNEIFEPTTLQTRTRQDQDFDEHFWYCKPIRFGFDTDDKVFFVTLERTKRHMYYDTGLFAETIYTPEMLLWFFTYDELNAILDYIG